jgi:hypothetical protein
MTALHISGNRYNLTIDEQQSTTAVTFDDAVTEVGDDALADMPLLETIAFPSDVTHFGRRTLLNCPALKSVTFGRVPANASAVPFGINGHGGVTVAFVRESAGAGAAAVRDRCNGVVRVVSKNDGTAESMFEVPLTHEEKERVVAVKFAANVRTISHELCSGCSTLDYLHIPDAVKTIGAWAFCGCVALRSIRVHANTLLGTDETAFAICGNLTSMMLHGINSDPQGDTDVFAPLPYPGPTVTATLKKQQHATVTLTLRNMALSAIKMGSWVVLSKEMAQLKTFAPEDYADIIYQ